MLMQSCFSNSIILRRRLPELVKRFNLQNLRNNSNALKSGVKKEAVPKTTAILVPSAKQNKAVGYWLLGMSGMCFGAIALGGITRLTESGLSMVNWHPVKETPPTNEEEWQREFENYKQYPEYKYVVMERGVMTLNEFKRIWYMEYVHRMWGRSLGVCFLVPALYFYARGYFDRGMKIRVPIFAALIGLQGLLGWYMVKSGLNEKSDPKDVPRVSHYRLAAHLGAAMVLYSLFVWSAMSKLVKPVTVRDTSSLKWVKVAAHSTKSLIILTALSGALVAGLDAGLTYNSWPKMADRWVPSDLIVDDIRPPWRNFLDNPTAVQFMHRHLAELTGLCGVTLWWLASRRYSHLLPRRARLWVHALLGMMLTQSTLGVSTLLLYVPTWLAALHQSGAMLLLTCALGFTHSLRRLPK